MSRGSIDIPVVSKFDPTGLKQAQGALKGFGKSLLSVGALVAGAFAIRGIVNFGMESVLAAERAAQFNNILGQVARTTGVFGADVDAATDRMIKFADSHELVIGIEAELIKESQAVLLSFKAVGASGNEVGGVFDRATKAAFDLTGVLKTDARSAAVQLGKALENPIKGITALGKAGTTFTEQQKEQIRVLQESGDLLGAQELILTEVESQYGGVAAAAALSSEKIKLSFGQVQDALGDALAPSFEKFATFFINEVVPPLTKFFEEDFPRFLENIQPVVDGVVAFISDIGQGLKDFLNIDDETTLLEGILAKFSELGDNPEFVAFIDTVGEIFEEIGEVLPGIVENVGSLALKLDPILKGTLDNVIPLARDFGTILDGIDFFLGEIIDSFGDFEIESPGFLTLLDRFLNPMARVRVAAEGVAKAVNAVVTALQRVKDAGGKPFDALMGTTFHPTTGFTLGSGRADGGRVTGGMPYLVGERGPELFMPGRGGNIVPNDRLGGGGGSTFNIVINANVADARLGEVVVNAIKRYERTSGPVFAGA